MEAIFWESLRANLDVYKMHTDTKENLPMMVPQCMLAYGSSPVRISHITIPNE